MCRLFHKSDGDHNEWEFRKELQTEMNLKRRRLMLTLESDYHIGSVSCSTSQPTCFPFAQFDPSECMNVRLSRRCVCQKHALQLQTWSVVFVFCLYLVPSVRLWNARRCSSYQQNTTSAFILPNGCNYRLIIPANDSIPNAINMFERLNLYCS